MQIDSTPRILQAGERYEQRKYVEAAPEQTRRRAKYLARNLARTKAEMLASEAVNAGAPTVSAEAVARISQERIIGSSDLLDINYLELAIAVGRAVARIQIGIEFGTGF